MSPIRRNSYPRLFCLATAFAITGGCVWPDFDRLQNGNRTLANAGGQLGAGGGVADAGGDDSGTTGGTSDAGASSLAGDASIGGSSNGGSASSGGSATGGTSAMTAGASGVGGGSGGTASTGGSSGIAPSLGPWNFDSAADVALWPTSEMTTVGSTTTWVAEGETDPLGSLALTSTGDALLYFAIPPANADQSNRMLNFRLRTTTGTVLAKAYAEGTGWVWADGGTSVVGTVWMTVSVSLSTPSYMSSPTYTATSLFRLGIEIPVSGTIWVDRIWLE